MVQAAKWHRVTQAGTKPVQPSTACLHQRVFGPLMQHLLSQRICAQDIDKFVPKKFQHYIGGALQCAS